MYENRDMPLLAKHKFRKRMLVHVLAAVAFLLVTLAIGVAGHMYFDDMQLSRAFVGSVTLSSGLGLSAFPESTEGQMFVAFYGLFSGYVYIITTTIVLAPVLHRVLHRFHLDE